MDRSFHFFRIIKKSKQIPSNINMIFTFPTATIASFSGAAFVASLPLNQVAASNSLEEYGYPSSGSIRAAIGTDGAECSLKNEFKLNDSDADVGILSCGKEEVCAQDNSSSVGGRCIKVKYSGEVKVVVESHRHLAESCNFLNGTAGIKCDGIDACLGADASKIGCGSCIGDSSCNSISGDATIGENSCVGEKACYEAGGIIGDGSCHDNVACMRLKGKIYGLGHVIYN